MIKELPFCDGCEYEYECVNMVCFYELLEKEMQKIRADAYDTLIEWLQNDLIDKERTNEYTSIL